MSVRPNSRFSNVDVRSSRHASPSVSASTQVAAGGTQTSGIEAN
jgi:hypothetical protein